MPDYTHSIVEVADRLIAVLEGATEILGIKKVYYGAQVKVPDFPSLAVEAMPKIRTLSGQGMTHKYAIDFQHAIYIYFGTVDSAEINIRESELLAENVEEILHEDPSLGGAVIFGFVGRVEPGVARIQSEFIKVTRLVWEAKSRQIF